MQPFQPPRFISMRRLTFVVSVMLCAAVTLRAQSNVPKTLIVRPKSGDFANKTLYTNSHAVIVGISRYAHLPKDKWLSYAAKDATDLREVLVRSYGFASENVTLLVDEQATRFNITQALANLVDSNRVGKDDRVLVFFSGHGQTVPLNSGDMGFLIPYDAKVDLSNPQNAGPYVASCLPMDNLWTYLNATPARHALLLADACYGGLLAQPRGLNEKPNPKMIANLAARPARQVITAGGKDEEAFEDPKLGHGALTYKLLEELRARATTPDDIFLSAELAGTLKVSVGNLTDGRQTPQFGSYRTEGEFLFVTTEPRPVPPPTTAVVPAPPLRPTPAPVRVVTLPTPIPTPRPTPKIAFNPIPKPQTKNKPKTNQKRHRNQTQRRILVRR